MQFRAISAHKIADGENSLVLGKAGHCLHPVLQKIEEDLLDLHLVQRHRGKGFIQFQLDRHLVPTRFELQKLDGLPDDLVDVLEHFLGVMLADEVTDPMEDFPRLFEVADRQVDGMGDLVDAAALLEPKAAAVQVVKRADQWLAQLMGELTDLVRRARGAGIRSSEITDPTITVTNLGDIGVESVFGVIYPPQVALVGFGKIVERPWVSQYTRRPT